MQRELLICIIFKEYYAVFNATMYISLVLQLTQLTRTSMTSILHNHIQLAEYMCFHGYCM